MKLRPLIFAKRGGSVATPARSSSSSSSEIGKRLTEVVQQAYSKPFSLQSDFARSNSFYVAAAASLGYITTRTSPKTYHYGPLWRTTKAGLHFLERD